MFDNMPPGIWLRKMSVSTRVADSKAAYFGRTVEKWSRMRSSRSMSSSVV